MEAAVKNRIITRIRNIEYKDESIVHIVESIYGWFIKKQGFKNIIETKKSKNDAINFASNLSNIKMIKIFEKNGDTKEILLWIMNKNVFINCPFDNEYFPLLKSTIFTLCYLNLKPVISETFDSGENRLAQIIEMMKKSNFSIHDLSRIEPFKNNELPRFNMPFELGIDFGIKSMLNDTQINKNILIFEKEKYRYKQVISDISGNDIKAHNNQIELVMKGLRDWFKTLNLFYVPSYKELWSSYIEFRENYEKIILIEELDPNDINSLTFTDIIELSQEWIVKSKN